MGGKIHGWGLFCWLIGWGEELGEICAGKNEYHGILAKIIFRNAQQGSWYCKMKVS